jgi:hypothetical protein
MRRLHLRWHATAIMSSSRLRTIRLNRHAPVFEDSPAPSSIPRRWPAATLPSVFIVRNMGVMPGEAVPTQRPLREQRQRLRQVYWEVPVEVESLKGCLGAESAPEVVQTLAA